MTVSVTVVGPRVRRGGGGALYATDASNDRPLPVAVATPASIDDVLAAGSVAERHGVPVVARGCDEPRRTSTDAP